MPLFVRLPAVSTTKLPEPIFRLPLVIAPRFADIADNEATDNLSAVIAFDAILFAVIALAAILSAVIALATILYDVIQYASIL